MKILENRSAQTKLTVADLLNVRYDQTRLTLASEMLGQLSDMPMLTPLSRALFILIPPTDVSAAPGTLYERLSILPLALEAIGPWLTRAASVDRNKLDKDIFTDAGLPFVEMTGLNQYIKDNVFTSADIYRLTMFARPGAVGPVLSQREVLGIVGQMLAWTNDSRNVTSFVDQMPMALEIISRCKLMELGRTILADVKPAAGDDGGTVTIAQRISVIRKIASSFAAVRLQAVNVLMNHIVQVATHPWIQTAIRGKMHVDMTQALEALKSASWSPLGASSWTEFNSPTIFDKRIVGPWLAANPPVPDAATQLPDARAFATPLAMDMSYRIAVPPQFPSMLVDAIWKLREEADDANAVLMRVSSGEAVGEMPSPVTVQEDWFSGELAPLNTEVAELPLISKAIPRARWTPRTITWKLLEKPFSEYKGYMFGEVEQAVLKSELARAVPVYVTGSSVGPELPGMPTMLPYVEVFDAPIMRYEASIDTLLTVWNRNHADLQALLESITGDVTENTVLRAIADRLRFVGAIQVLIEDNQSHGWITPFDRHWYHASSPDSFVSKTEGFELGSIVSSIGSGSTKTLTRVTLRFRPFAGIPASALSSRIADSIALITTRAQRDHRPLAVWEAQGTQNPVLVPFHGWRISQANFTDVVLIETAFESARPVHISEHPDSKEPYQAYKYNAIVTIDGESAPVHLGSTRALPIRHILPGDAALGSASTTPTDKKE